MPIDETFGADFGSFICRRFESKTRKDSKLDREKEKLMSELKEKLGPEHEKLFRKYDDCYGYIIGMEMERAYKIGFADGIQLMGIGHEQS